MNFINALDISEKEDEELTALRHSKFKCNAVSKLASVPARVQLDFRRTNEKGNTYSYLSVSWSHSIPQPFGLHIIPNGQWDISKVTFGGALFRKACRLHTAIDVLERNKHSLTDPKKLAELQALVEAKDEIITQKDLELQAKEAEIERLSASAAKAKGKLHDLRKIFADAQALATPIDESSESRQEDEAGPSNKPSNNDALFKSWVGDGDVD
ncbi:hypothetical protein CGV09_s2gp1 [Lettuce necrotic leaf curl virus]|uniref:Uncharacterized protein n=1 Tax=Lettuce necrotic leaf curl virus TaxID=1358807 RepID=S5MZG4_9SECO|nr:hypothetical protein CGV09_s2gp1 [Lettuce necrotic leaf curl virus]AGR55591.1 hypothetical protein [Lettuce necrotic leaf curl virus]